MTNEETIRGKRARRNGKDAPDVSKGDPGQPVPNVKGPHHVKLTADRGQGAVTYSRTFRDRDSAAREATAKRRMGYQAVVMTGRAPIDALPGVAPGTETEDQKATRRAAGKASRTPKEKHPCKCGCGAMVANLYAQGHDARHVSHLAGEYKDRWEEAEDIDKLAAEILAPVKFSDRLTIKLRRSMELIDQKFHKQNTH